ncbi:hypothetical protein [Flavobacterium sp.]|jgi:hypothetical protein|uniref:hypothetical protein n=1 Tax=Flavobacterium sp. TaxID=239 RepID=UPI0037BE8D25
MNTDKKQSSNLPANEISKNQILNTEDDYINPKDTEEDEKVDVDDEDLEEAENPVDSPGSDFNEFEEEIDEEGQ